jgi:peptide/nickel transport system substrate-binding protein
MPAIALACALVSYLLTLPSGGHAAAPTSIKIAIGIDADSLNPEGQTTTTVGNVVDYMFDSLLWPNDERSGVQPGQPQYTRLVPMLATSWTVSRDGLTYTFKLRQGVKFQDGTDFNAEAVKFNVERWLDPAVRNPSRYYFTDIDPAQIETPDPYTLVLHLKQPSPTLLERMAAGAGEILSPAAVKKIGNDKIPLGPVDAGSGPYRFKEWVHGDHITLAKNPAYWGPKPFFDEVVVRIVPNAGTRETMLRAGDIQLAFEPPAPDGPALRKDPSLNVVQGPSDRDVFVGLNTQRGPFKDVKVRQAMNYAVNKRAIIQSILFGLATVLESPTTPALFGYTKLQPGGWPFNPVTAKQLLAEAGFPNGFAVNFMIAHGTVYPGLSDGAGHRRPAGQPRDPGRDLHDRLADVHQHDHHAARADAARNVRARVGHPVPRRGRGAVRAVLLGTVAAEGTGADVLQESQGGRAAADRADRP